MFDDFFAPTGGGAPAISFAQARAKEGFKAVILPKSLEEATIGHDTVQSTDNDTGAALFWNPIKNASQKRITESHTDGVKNRPVTQAVMKVQTQLKDWEFTSAIFQGKVAEDKERTDDGQRRLYIGGGDIQTKLGKAMQAAGVRAPEVGATISVTVTGRIPNNYGSTSPVVEVTYSKPTAETKKIVDKHLDDLRADMPQPEVGAFPGMDDGLPPF